MPGSGSFFTIRPVIGEKNFPARYPMEKKRSIIDVLDPPAETGDLHVQRPKEGSIP